MSSSWFIAMQHEDRAAVSYSQGHMLKQISGEQQTVSLQLLLQSSIGYVPVHDNHVTVTQIVADVAKLCSCHNT
jgi:hypothetical protein